MSRTRSDVVPEAIAKTGLRTIRRPTDPAPATPEEEALLERAAELRADCTTWEKTAEQLKVDPAELEALVKAHKYLFKRLLFRADREAAREDRRLARVVFRKQIGKDPTTQAARLSAQCLVNIDLTYYRHRNKKPPLCGLDPNDPKLKDAIKSAEFMAATTHEERMQLLESFMEGHVHKRMGELGLGKHYQPKKGWLSEDDLRGFGG